MSIINDFSGGINNNSPANQLQPNQVVEALNIIIDKRSNLVSRRGLTRINYNKNLLQRTEELEHATWLLVNTPIITANTSVAPDGTTTADTIEDNSNTVQEGVRQQIVGVVSNNQKYTGSIYIKKTGAVSIYPVLQMQFFSVATITARIIVDTLNGVVIDNIGSPPTSKSITDAGDYWRVSITFTNDNVGNVSCTFNILPAYATDLSGNIDLAAMGSNIFWGAQLELGNLSAYHKNVGSSPTVAANYLTSKLTSLYHFRKAVGTSDILVTSGAKVWRLGSDDYFIDATGGLTVPTDTYWQWVTYRDTAYGVNRGSGANVNPVKYTTIGGNIAALVPSAGTIVKPRYVEVWQDRLWWVDNDNPNTVQCSPLGNAEGDYSVGGASGSQKFEIGGAESSNVTGLKVYKGVLFFFKADKIYYLDFDSVSPADATKYSIKIFSRDVGYISGYSIQEVINDLVGLSRYGLVPLSATEKFGDFEFSVISENIERFKNFSIFNDTCASVVDPSTSQYLLSFSSVITGVHDSTYVADFSQSPNGLVGFTQFDGRMIAPCFGRVLFEGRDRIYVGGYIDSNDEGIAYLYRYDDEGVYIDDNKLYTKKIRSAAHDDGLSLEKKRFHNWELTFELLTSSLTLGFSYRFDESPVKQTSFSKDFSGVLFSGGTWGSAIWGTSTWAEVSTAERIFKKKIVGSNGRIGRNIQFTITNDKEEGFILKGYMFNYTPLTSKVL